VTPMLLNVNKKKNVKINSSVKVKLGLGGRRAPRKHERFEEDYDEYDFY